MPKQQRSPEEIQAVKDDILNQSVQLMAEKGFEGFSMRKLSARLGIAAKTIYNYYKNKDELYLAILTLGFERLHDLCESAGADHADPVMKVEAMVRAFFDFGLEESHFYNLMFTWHVPKYNDYVGTEMEPAARIELDAAMKLADLFIDAVKSCAPSGGEMPEKEARFIMINFFTRLHGFVASYNNTLLQYMHEDPGSLIERTAESIRDQFIWDVGRLKQ